MKDKLCSDTICYQKDSLYGLTVFKNAGLSAQSVADNLHKAFKKPKPINLGEPTEYFKG